MPSVGADSLSQPKNVRTRSMAFEAVRRYCKRAGLDPVEMRHSQGLHPLEKLTQISDAMKLQRGCPLREPLLIHALGVRVGQAGTEGVGALLRAAMASSYKRSTTWLTQPGVQYRRIAALREVWWSGRLKTAQLIDRVHRSCLAKPRSPGATSKRRPSV